MPHRAPQDAPQDIAAPLVRRIDAIRQEERDGARMVGEDAVGRAGRAAVVRPPHDLDGLGDDRLKQVGVEI